MPEVRDHGLQFLAHSWQCGRDGPDRGASTLDVIDASTMPSLAAAFANDVRRTAWRVTRDVPHVGLGPTLAARRCRLDGERTRASKRSARVITLRDPGPTRWRPRANARTTFRRLRARATLADAEHFLHATRSMLSSATWRLSTRSCRRSKGDSLSTGSKPTKGAAVECGARTFSHGAVLSMLVLNISKPQNPKNSCTGDNDDEMGISTRDREV
jgi:hypothetical protein